MLDPETLGHVLQLSHTAPDQNHLERKPMRRVRGHFVGGNKHSRAAVLISFYDVTSDRALAMPRVFDPHVEVEI